MARVPLGHRRVDLILPAALARQIEGYLNLPAQERVPYGTLTTFFTQLAREFFATKPLHMGDYLGFGQGEWVSGRPETLRKIREILAVRKVTPEGQDKAFPELSE